MWPFHNHRRLTIVHKVPGLSELAKAIRYAARQDRAAREYEARVRGNFIRPKPSKTEMPDPPEWTAWEEKHVSMDENERLHLKWAYDVLRGVEKTTDAKRLEAINLYNAAQDAYDLPRLDGRPMMEAAHA